MQDDDALARQCNSLMLSGRLRKAVRLVTDCDGGGVLQPDDACSKTGRPVLEVLTDKHPLMREPVLSPDLDPTCFKPHPAVPAAAPLTTSQEMVKPMGELNTSLPQTELIDANQI
mgnify:CR=1 FL=1